MNTQPSWGIDLNPMFIGKVPAPQSPTWVPSRSDDRVRRRSGRRRSSSLSPSRGRTSAAEDGDLSERKFVAAFTSWLLDGHVGDKALMTMNVAMPTTRTTQNAMTITSFRFRTLRRRLRPARRLGKVQTLVVDYTPRSSTYLTP